MVGEPEEDCWPGAVGRILSSRIGRSIIHRWCLQDEGGEPDYILLAAETFGSCGRQESTVDSEAD
jgi:hypothetical protein